MRLNRFVAEEQTRLPVEPAEPRQEWNVCGVLVHARSEKRADVETALRALPGVDVHHAGADGRMVVTIEDVDGSWAGATLTRLYEIEGVVGASLVFHQSDQSESVTGEKGS